MVLKILDVDLRQLLVKFGTEYFEVPVSGNMVTNEYYGTIDIPEFYAEINGELTDNLYIENVLPEIRERSINSQFYQSINHITNIYPLSGGLTGQLYEDECIPFKVSGILSGELSYHTLENIENSPTWQITPQVRRFF